MTTDQVLTPSNPSGDHHSRESAPSLTSPDERHLDKLRVLVVDDEQFLCDMLTRLLSRRDYEVVAFSDGGSALELLRKEPFDAVLLDICMPERDGVGICRELRTFSDAVVIILTALNRPDDVIHGFMAGADDYITKPFRLRELDARIRANVRRAMLSHRLGHTASDYTDNLALNYETREVLIANQVRQFPVKEFALLSYLVERANQPVDKSELLWEIWGYKNAARANLVETAVRRVRVKLEADPARPVRLVTCRPAGYMYVRSPAVLANGSGEKAD